MSDMFNYDNSTSPPPRVKLDLWDILSILTLVATVFVGLFIAAIFIMPNSALNPLPPIQSNPYLVPPTLTVTPIQLDPTWTPTPVDATETPTLFPTFTLEPSPTLLSFITPSRTPSPTRTPRAPFSATVTYIDSTIIHTELGCNWQGIGGTIVDTNNADMLSLTIRLSGFYNGRTKQELTVSGIAPVYGRSGFEFFLGSIPLASSGELFIQVFDQAGLPLSDNIALDTFNDCSKNLALVRFKKNP
jgi:hypothetical protein